MKRGLAWVCSREADRQVRRRSSGPRTNNFMIDITWVTNRIALGGAIWRVDNMAELARAGVTHVLDMQIEFDDTPLGDACGITVLWDGIDDDFQPKPAEVFRRGVEFARRALDETEAKLYVHCAAGVHRAPMMVLAILCSLGWEFDAALEAIENSRPTADFPDVYLNSVKAYLQQESSFKA